MNDLIIPEHWENKTFRELEELKIFENIQDGNHGEKHPKASDYVSNGIPFVMANNLDRGKVDLVNSKKIPEKVSEKLRIGFSYEGDILLSHKGTIGETAVVPALSVPYIMLTPQVTFYRIGKKDILFNKFVQFYFMSPIYQNEIKSISKQATRDYVGITRQKEFSCPIPPRDEQERIVQKIESCFLKINETEKALTEVEVLLAKYRESLLAKAFRGELIPQDPKDEPASKLLEKIRAERAQNSNVKKEQEFAPISDDEKPFDLPKGWEWVRLGEIIFIESGGTPKELPIESDGTHIDFIKVGDMNESTDGKVIDKVQISLSANTVKNLRIKSLPAGTIIFPKRGGAILTNKKRMLVREAACDTNIMGIICPSEMKEYLWWWFQSIHLATLHTGSTIPQINNGDINPLIFPLPPLSYQDKIINCLENKIKKCDEIKATVDHEIALVHNLKSSILENAFRGLLVPRILSEGTGFQLLEIIRQSKDDSSEEKKKKSSMNKIKNSENKKAKK